MDTMINEIEIVGDYKSINLTTGKKNALILINMSNNEVNVICNNAAHQAMRGCGRYFDNIKDAITGYKSTAMKSMIKLAGTL